MMIHSLFSTEKVMEMKLRRRKCVGDEDTPESIIEYRDVNSEPESGKTLLPYHPTTCMIECQANHLLQSNSCLPFYWIAGFPEMFDRNLTCKNTDELADLSTHLGRNRHVLDLFMMYCMMLCI